MEKRSHLRKFNILSVNVILFQGDQKNVRVGLSGRNNADSGLFTKNSSDFRTKRNKPFSKMAAENSNRSILKTFTSTRKNSFTLVTLPSFNISGVISAEKM